MNVASPPIRVDRARDGAVVYRIEHAPALLPGVSGRELEAAWDAATAAACRGECGPERRLCFEDGALELRLADRDARCWALGVDRVAALHTSRGVSLLLRLLGLVAAMAEHRFARKSPPPALFRAAASATLGDDARLEAESLGAGLSPSSLNSVGVSP